VAQVTVDGIVYEMNPANNLLQECLSQGLDLPYFCWHPCMGSVGACRQCAVTQYRNNEDKTGIVVMACMTPASNGGIISIKDAQAVKFRANVIESLMISHPHDCPVCEEGGECHLQDMTQMSGHNYRRYDFNKVTHRNQYLGPFINHEMNRCIACYRCVRFYSDYAGGSDLAVLATHHHVYFGRHEEGVLENEFSGNLVEVCPTGVFTDKPFSQHYTRKWDLQTAPSICTGCGAGCNTTPGEREGTLRRIVNRYHHELNAYFLCDRGRFGYGYTNSARRIRNASSVNGKGERQVLTTAAAREQFAALTRSNVAGNVSGKVADDITSNFTRKVKGKVKGKVIGIGSPRASLEDNFALRKLLGPENFHAGCSDGQYRCLRAVTRLYREDALQCPDIRTLEQSDCTVIIAEDITNTAPRLALAVRQASRNLALEMAADNRIPLWQDAAVRSLAQHSRSPVYIIGPQATRLDDVAAETFLGSAGQQLTLLRAITAALNLPSEPASTDDAANALAKRIAQSLARARQPVIISGITTESEAMVHATAELARALQRHRMDRNSSQTLVDLCFAMPEVNTMGLGLLLEEGGGSLGEALQRLATGAADTVIVLENDLTRRAAAADIEQALNGNGDTRPRLIVIDQLHNAFNARAELLLPATSFAEQNSTWVNYEGRAQSSYQVFRSDCGAQPARDWLDDALDFPVDAPFVRRAALLHDCADELPTFARLPELIPTDTGLWTMKAPRQPHRFSGRTALAAADNVHEPRRPEDTGSPFTFSMEGMPPLKDSRLLAAAWAPGWNSNQAISKFQDEVNGELKQGCKGVHLLSHTTGQESLPPTASSVGSTPGNASREFELFFISHIFGGDELSSAAPAIEARSSGAYLSLGQQDAARLGLAQYSLAEIDTGTSTLRLPVLIRTRIASGSAGIYCAGEVDRYALGASADIRPVPRNDAVIASSRQMFEELIIPDRVTEDQR